MHRSKKCFKCGNRKKLAAFYKHKMMADGHLNKCKECTKGDVASYRSGNIAKVRKYDRERAKQPHRIAIATQITRRWRDEDRRRARCHNAVARAIRSGAITRLPCSECGEPRSHAHHHDYDKPLAVAWLCAACHSNHHHLVKAGGNS